jgi:hypothetical protein
MLRLLLLNYTVDLVAFLCFLETGTLDLLHIIVGALERLVGTL